MSSASAGDVPCGGSVAPRVSSLQSFWSSFHPLLSRLSPFCLDGVLDIITRNMLGRLLAPKDRSGGLLYKQTTELVALSNGCAHPELIYGARQTTTGTTLDIGTRVVAEIDLAAIVHNTREIQKRAIKSHCNLFAIVKANAYGHGAVAVAHTLACCNKIDAFGVATLAEAIELRESGLPASVRILVLGASIDVSEWIHYAEHDLDIMVSSAEAAEELIQWTTAEALAGRLKRPIRAHVMLNTGMSRIGLATFSRDVLPSSADVPSATPSRAPSAPGLHAERAAAVVQKIHDASDAALEFVAICSHMSEAKAGSDFAIQQFQRLASVVHAVRALGIAVPMIHAENSESLLADCVPDCEFIKLLHGNPPGRPHTVGYARSGGGIYGQRTFDYLKPAITLKAQVRHVHVAKKNVPVGYDRAWSAPEDSIIATLAVGFADGYSRENSNAGSYGKAAKVGVRGQLCDIAGKVCMDMLMVVCCPGSTMDASPIQTGDYAVLYGAGGPSLAEHAANLGTALSDVTCDLSQRVRRSYVNVPVPPATLRKRGAAAKPSSLPLRGIGLSKSVDFLSLAPSPVRGLSAIPEASMAVQLEPDIPTRGAQTASEEPPELLELRRIQEQLKAAEASARYAQIGVLVLGVAMLGVAVGVGVARGQGRRG